jgi:hypothetical protein
MADYHEANDAQNKAILVKLADESGDTEIAAVISCYTIGSTGSDIRKDLNKHKVPPLKKSAIYLQLYPEGDTKKLKAEIITDIMRRINSLLMDLCGVCGDYFHTELKEKPLFKCLLCHQGCHTKCFNPLDTMFRQLDANHRKAIQFICTSCHSDHNDDEEITINAPKVKKSPIKAEPVAKDSDLTGAVYSDFSDDHSSAQIPKQSPVKEVPIPDINHEAEVVSYADDINGLILDDQTGENVNITTSNHQTRSINSEHLTAICPDYKWGRCPNFEQCEYRHPPRCWDWLSNGRCAYKNKCRYHHPPLCWRSVWEKKCLNESCKFFHITSTLRRNIEDEQLKSSLHANSYQIQQNQQVRQHHPPPRPTFQQPPRLQQPPHQPPPPQQPQHQSPPPPSHHPHQPPHPSHHPHHPHQPVASAPHHNEQQTQNKLSNEDISFLVKTLKTSLREDLEKEIGKIKQMLNQQQQNPQLIQPQPNRQIIQQQLQTPPNLYNLQMIPHHQ